MVSNATSLSLLVLYSKNSVDGKMLKYGDTAPFLHFVQLHAMYFIPLDLLRMSSCQASN